MEWVDKRDLVLFGIWALVGIYQIYGIYQICQISDSIIENELKRRTENGASLGEVCP